MSAWWVESNGTGSAVWCSPSARCTAWGHWPFSSCRLWSGQGGSPLLSRATLPLLFPAAALVCTAVEYVTGLFYEKVFRVSFWDYSHLPLNLGGRVCLLFALFWGVLALLVLHVIHPAAAWLAARIPLWAFPPAVLATALDTLLTARLLRRTGDPNSLRWYARMPRRRPA